MWVFTEKGFVSVVKDTKKPGMLIVRARDAESLSTISAMSGSPVVKSPLNDYPYRVFVDPQTYSLWLMETASEINYTNFKNHMYKVRGSDFAHSLSRVWEVMCDTEDLEARK